MYSLSRSSLATGPNIRVPFGFLSSLIITAAFSSKRIYVPSSLLRPFAERTITALTTSPFLNGCHYHITDISISSACAAQNSDTHKLFGSGVVSDLHIRLHLYHSEFLLSEAFRLKLLPRLYIKLLSSFNDVCNTPSLIL